MFSYIFDCFQLDFQWASEKNHAKCYVAISGLRIMVFLLQNRVTEKPNAQNFEDFGIWVGLLQCFE